MSTRGPSGGVIGGLIALIVTTAIGAMFTPIGEEVAQRLFPPEETPTPTTPSPSPLPTPTSPPPDGSRKNCIGITYNFYPQFYFYSNQPSFNVGMIMTVMPGYPAAHEGLQQGDVIMSLNGQPISSKLRIQQILSTLKVGDVTYVRIIRPTSYQITNQAVSVSPPYSEMNLEVPVGLCSL